jgi:Tfp pilus assembly protein PilN
VRAVNLVPPEHRRASTPGGRTGGAAYGVLGVLALVLIVVTTLTLTKAEVRETEHELARVRAETAAAQRAVEDLRAYTRFAQLRETRVATVNALAASRFDWASALREVARTVPAGVWLAGLRATVSPTVSVDGGTPDPLRPASNDPAIEVQGCTTGQRRVAELVAELRRIDGVQRVSLSSSEKAGNGGPASGPAQPLNPAVGGTVDPCVTPGRPRFSLTVFFRAPSAPAPTNAVGATTAVSTTTATP